MMAAEQMAGWQSCMIRLRRHTVAGWLHRFSSQAEQMSEGCQEAAQEDYIEKLHSMAA